MKIYIMFQLKQGPSGGGNQFLASLGKYFSKKGCLAENPGAADIILYNSYQYIPETVTLKKKYPRKYFIHRIDGPIRLYNQLSDRRDAVTNSAAHFIADAVVFQSEWSRQQNFCLGLKRPAYETTIMNAPDPDLFNRINRQSFSADRKTRIIATSWSSNMNKGFDDYLWLDNNLDFRKYQITFCGRTPIDFKNIIHVPPLRSSELAEELKKNDIFLTASQNDPCSNSLIEGLHCGLPALVKNSGGHPEIIQKTFGGLTFDSITEVPDLLNKICGYYAGYQGRISPPSMEQVTARYLEFFDYVLSNKHQARVFGPCGSLFVGSAVFKWKFFEKINAHLFSGK